MGAQADPFQSQPVNDVVGVVGVVGVVLAGVVVTGVVVVGLVGAVDPLPPPLYVTRGHA